MTTPVEFPLDPDEIHPFSAYRRTAGGGRDFDLASSLTHFFESEKFRTTGLEDVRVAILSAPTARRARSISRQHMASWRADWKEIRGRVFRAGLAMQAAQSRHMRTVLKAVADDALLWSSQSTRTGTMPVSWMAQQILTLAQGRLDGASPRVGMLLLDRYTPKDIADRLSALFSGEAPHGAALFIGEEANPAVETWCVNHAVPIRYVGNPDRRLRSRECLDLLERVNSLVLCAPGTRKDVRELLALARKQKVALHNLSTNLEPAVAATGATGAITKRAAGKSAPVVRRLRG